MASQRKNRKNNRANSKDKNSIFDYVQGNNIEIIVAALLLSGKLRFDSIQLFREASVVVSLVGQYETLFDLSSVDVNRMNKILNENEKMTITTLIQKLTKSTKT